MNGDKNIGQLGLKKEKVDKSNTVDKRHAWPLHHWAFQTVRLVHEWAEVLNLLYKYQLVHPRKVDPIPPKHQPSQLAFPLSGFSFSLFSLSHRTTGSKHWFQSNLKAQIMKYRATCHLHIDDIPPQCFSQSHSTALYVMGDKMNPSVFYKANFNSLTLLVCQKFFGSCQTNKQKDQNHFRVTSLTAGPYSNQWIREELYQTPLRDLTISTGMTASCLLLKDDHPMYNQSHLSSKPRPEKKLKWTKLSPRNPGSGEAFHLNSKL